MNYAVLICPFFIPAMGHYISKTDLLRCPCPCATLSTPMGNVVLGRVQRTCSFRGTNGCYLSMDLGQVEMVGRFRDVEDRCLGI